MNRKEYNIAAKTFSSRLFAFFVKNCKSRELANDLVQDTFEKLWINRDSVDENKAKQWLFTTGYRLMLNAIKKESRMDVRDEVPEVSFRSEENDQFENKDLIEKLLQLLSPQQQSIILLRDYEGYDYKEIGNILNLSESQVKVYLFRARKRLKEQLKKNKHLVA